MIIRKATIKDFEALKDIKTLSKKEELKYSQTLNTIDKNKERYFSYLKRDLTIDNRAVFIALKEDKIIGMVLAKHFKPLSISKYSKKGYISNLYVCKGYRNKEIGKELSKHALKWIKENNTHHVTLEIHIDNKAAISLYHALGFKDYTIKLAKKI